MKFLEMSFFCLMLLVFGVFAQSSDKEIIRSLLDINGYENVAVEDVATFKDEKAIKLNLNNPDITQDGFTIIPPTIGQLASLLTLSANDNDIKTLPKEIANLVSLVELELKSNTLFELPPEIGKLKQLKILDLRNNELRKLPSEIAQLENLWKLQLWGNELSDLPEEIGKMKSLKELYLRNNRLKTLPKAIMTMNLSYLGIQDNKLCDLDPELESWLKKRDERYRSWQKCW